MKKYIFITLVLLLILLVLTACELSWAKPELAFDSYDINVKSTNSGYKYILLGTIDNSGVAGKYLVEVSFLPLDSEKWVNIDYGPRNIDKGSNTFNFEINIDNEPEKFKIKLFVVTDSGKKIFQDEVTYTVDDYLIPELAFDNYSINEEIKYNGYSYELEGTIVNTGAAGKYGFEILGLPLGEEDEEDNWIIEEEYGPILIDEENTSLNRTIETESDMRFDKIKINLFSINNAGERIDQQLVVINLSSLSDLPNLGFENYTIEEENNEDGNAYNISASILNSGAQGEFIVCVSGLLYGEDDVEENWISFGDYGPVLINQEKEYEQNIKTDDRFKQFRIQLYVLEDGQKTLNAEVFYHLFIEK